MAVTMLMGGVTGGEFWKTCLALLNGLFLSLATGLFVSTISRSSQRAMGGTVLVLALFMGAGPAVDSVLAGLRQARFEPLFSLSSPVFLFLSGSHQTGAGLFWQAALINQVIAWAFLGTAFGILPRTWQDKTAKGAPAHSPGRRRGRRGLGTSLRSRRFLAVNPVRWLLSRQSWQSVVLWIGTLAVLGALVGMLFLPDQWLVLNPWQAVVGLIILALYLLVASEAAKFHVEARRDGFLELLLIAPLNPSQIVAGQWSALARRFGPPLVLFLVLNLVGGVVVQHKTWKRIEAMNANSTAVVATNAPTPAVAPTDSSAAPTNAATPLVQGGPPAAANPALSRIQRPGLIVETAIPTAGAVMTLANLIALAWFGMWMGLTSKNLALATLKTLLFVQVLPWFVLTFASGLLAALVMVPLMMKNSGSGAIGSMTWFPLLTTGTTLILALAKDIGFCIFARRRLHSQFRERVAHVPGSIAPSAPAPPVLKAEPATE